MDLIKIGVYIAAKRNLNHSETMIKLESFDNIYDLDTGEVVWEKSA